MTGSATPRATSSCSGWRSPYGRARGAAIWCSGSAATNSPSSCPIHPATKACGLRGNCARVSPGSSSNTCRIRRSRSASLSTRAPRPAGRPVDAADLAMYESSAQEEIGRRSSRQAQPAAGGFRNAGNTAANLAVNVLSAPCAQSDTWAASASRSVGGLARRSTPSTMSRWRRRGCCLTSENRRQQRRCSTGAPLGVDDWDSMRRHPARGRLSRCSFPHRSSPASPRITTTQWHGYPRVEGRTDRGLLPSYGSPMRSTR